MSLSFHTFYVTFSSLKPKTLKGEALISCIKSEWVKLPGHTITFFSSCCLPFQLLDMKIFVDTDSDIRLVRRLRRDITERGRDIEGVIKQYNKFVKPAFEQYIEPTMRLADIVVPRGVYIYIYALTHKHLCNTATGKKAV